MKTQPADLDQTEPLLFSNSLQNDQEDTPLKLKSQYKNRHSEAIKSPVPFTQHVFKAPEQELSIPNAPTDRE